MQRTGWQGTYQVGHLRSCAAITPFLNKSLNQSNDGCHFYSICVNHLFHADDSVVIVTLLWLIEQLIDVCEKYSIEDEITYNATETVCMYIRPKHMHHIGPFERFLYGHWVDGYKYLGYYIRSDFIDDRDLKDQARAIYSRSNMIVRKFSNCSVDFKNQLSRSYISCLYCSAL